MRRERHKGSDGTLAPKVGWSQIGTASWAQSRCRYRAEKTIGVAKKAYDESDRAQQCWGEGQPRRFRV